MNEFKKKEYPKEILFSRRWFQNYILVVIGAFVLATGYALFIVPHNIVPGGIFGLSIVINHLTGLPVGLTAFAINIPLFLWGVKALGAKFGVKTALGMTLSSIFIDAIIYYMGDFIVTKDILVSTIFGGVMTGFGIAIVFKGGATTGGTDIIARIANKYFNIQVGRMFLITDGMIVLSSVLVFQDINLAPYSIIAIFAVSKSVDAIISGFDHKKVALIISEKHEEIADFILNRMDRGGTYISGRGMFYKEQERNIIFTVLNMKEVAVLQSHIKDIDKEAFITIMSSNEVFGSGFKPLE